MNLEDAIEAYWDVAYLEGREGRSCDDAKGSAQQALQNLLASIAADRAATAPDEREAFEAWADSMNYAINRDETDKYKDYHRATTRFAREGWLSALAWYTRRPALTTPDRAASPQNEQLMKFYGVSTTQALIDAQTHHIERLQAKLPATPSLAPTFPRG